MAENRVMNGTFMNVATKDAKGGALVSKVEFELTPENAAYLVDIKGWSCRMTIEPDEGQQELDISPDESQSELDVSMM